MIKMIRVIFSNKTSTWFQAALIRILNLMNPVSVKIGGHLDKYMAKVTLEYEGHTDNETLDILREAAYLKEVFCASCDVFVYDLDEEGNPDNCYMFKEPISYKCDTSPKRINVEIEFGELHDGPNIDKKCKEIEILRYYMEMMRKLMKEEFDKNSKNEDNDVKHFSEHSNMCAACSSKGHCMAGNCIPLQIEWIQEEANHVHISDNNKKEDDNMKHFSDCVGMCATCSSNGHCLAGIGDDDYVVADKAELIRRLKNDKLGEISVEEIKKVLKKEYGYDCDKEIDNSETTTRISKHEYYLKIAEAVSLRGTCLRRKFGAIIVKDDRIVSTGYVGAPRGRINCCDRGKCYRMEHNVPSGQRYELCRSTHAEMNAIIQASPEEMKDATLYLVGIENDGSYTNADCCSMCKRVIINSGIKTVIARQADGSFKKIHVTEWISNDDSLDIDHEGY
jgi:dCMP deaminase